MGLAAIKNINSDPYSFLIQNTPKLQYSNAAKATRHLTSELDSLPESFIYHSAAAPPAIRSDSPRRVRVSAFCNPDSGSQPRSS